MLIFYKVSKLSKIWKKQKRMFVLKFNVESALMNNLRYVFGYLNEIPKKQYFGVENWVVF